MVPVWVAALLFGWAVGATALAVWRTWSERRAWETTELALEVVAAAAAYQAELETNLPLMVMVHPDGVADATIKLDQACYWLN